MLLPQKTFETIDRAEVRCGRYLAYSAAYAVQPQQPEDMRIMKANSQLAHTVFPAGGDRYSFQPMCARCPWMSRAGTRPSSSTAQRMDSGFCSLRIVAWPASDQRSRPPSTTMKEITSTTVVLACGHSCVTAAEISRAATTLTTVSQPTAPSQVRSVGRSCPRRPRVARPITIVEVPYRAPYTVKIPSPTVQIAARRTHVRLCQRLRPRNGRRPPTTRPLT